MFSECGAYESCQKTCENPTGPMICPRICAPGCVCQDGFVKDNNGNCIKVEDCPGPKPIPKGMRNFAAINLLNFINKIFN
jgi:hypothetical protein